MSGHTRMDLDEVLDALACGIAFLATYGPPFLLLCGAFACLGA